MQKLLFAAGWVLLSVVQSGAAWAQTSPVKGPVKILVGFAPGGGADLIARMLADKMKDSLGTVVLVENKTGAGGRIAAEALKAAPADGNTLMLAPIVVPVIAPLVYPKLGYDPAKDFAPVAHVGNYEFGLAVPAAHPARNLRELGEWLKANRDKANFGSPAPGSLPHFFGIMVGKGLGVEMTHVAYKGGAPMLNDLIGGQITAGIDTLIELTEHHKAGKIRVLGVFSDRRSAVLPDVPTFKESGFADVIGTGWYAMYAPAGTPKPALDALTRSVVGAVQSADVKERFLRVATEPTGYGGDALLLIMKDDALRWGPVIKASGFKPE